MNLFQIASRVALPMHNFMRIKNLNELGKNLEGVEVNPPGITDLYKDFFKAFDRDVDVVRIDHELSRDRAHLESVLQPFVRPGHHLIVEARSRDTRDEGPAWLVHDALGHMGYEDEIYQDKGFERQAREAICEDWGLEYGEVADVLDFDVPQFIFSLIPVEQFKGAGERENPWADRAADLAILFAADPQNPLKIDHLDNVALVAVVNKKPEFQTNWIPEYMARNLKPRDDETLVKKYGKDGLPACKKALQKEIDSAYQTMGKYLDNHEGKIMFNVTTYG